MAETPRPRIPPELEDVATQVGAFMEYWGFKGAHGRAWTHLFLAADPLDARALTERLGVSKALVSITLAELLDYDVIVLAGKGERGAQLYAANPRVTDVIAGVLRKRERRMLAQALAAARSLESVPPTDSASIDPKRAQALIEMTAAAAACLDGLLKMDSAPFEGWTAFNLPTQ